MKLIDEEEKSKKRDSKVLMIAVVAIIILIFAAVGVLSYSTYLKSKQFKFYIDNQDKISQVTTNLFTFEDDDVYICINDIASLLGYEFNKGEYKKYNEDVTKCYVENQYEVAGFEADSERVYKIVLSDNEYEYFDLKTKVKSIDGKLYTTKEGIELGFNVKFNYDINKNQISIKTLDKIVKDYAKKLKNTVITSEKMSFSNKKALKYNFVLIQNSAGLYGIQDITSQELVLGTKYTNLKFMESSKDFIVTTPENKQGIISVSGGVSIEPQYDEIKQLDIDYDLYIVKTGEKYGVINRKKSGKYIIYPEYDSIGIDINNFKGDSISNPYILYDNCIPVKKVETVQEKKIEKWILFDKEGKKLSQNTFDGLGYIQGTSKNAQGNNVLLVPDVEGIIVYKDSKYGMINSVGRELLPITLKQIYSITSDGKNTYYMVYGDENKTVNIIEYLNKIMGTSNNTNTSNNLDNTTTNTINEAENNSISNNNELNNQNVVTNNIDKNTVIQNNIVINNSVSTNNTQVTNVVRANNTLAENNV